MAGHASYPNSQLSLNSRPNLRRILYAAMLLLPVTTASPISVNSEAVVVSSEPVSANPADAALSSLEKRASYMFNCYSAGQACRGLGDTRQGGDSALECSPISANGCTQYSFNGGGEWRLTGYLNRQCTGQEILRVNGGSVTCLRAPGNWGGYLITRM
jgi:hypothetical protein